MKIVLGINGGTRPGNQDSSASIIKDGKIVACIEEERFTRVKHAPGVLPENSIRFCLSEAKISIKDVDYVVFAGATYDNMKLILSNFFNLISSSVCELIGSVSIGSAVEPVNPLYLGTCFHKLSITSAFRFSVIAAIISFIISWSISTFIGKISLSLYVF